MLAKTSGPGKRRNPPESGVVKKTVALHPIMDKYVRLTWAILIQDGYDATYSTALNWMLLAAVGEAVQKRGLSRETREWLDSFLKDHDTLNKLNIQDRLVHLREFWGLNR